MTYPLGQRRGIDMKPMLRENVSLGTFEYEGSDEIHYYAESADGREYEISHSLWDALDQADGTHPLNLPDKGEYMLPTLREMGLIRTSRFVRTGRLQSRFTLFPIRQKARNPRIWKTTFFGLCLLSALFFPTGIILWASGGILIGPVFDGSLLGCILPVVLYVASILLHELGHMIAGFAFGLSSQEIGLSLFAFIPTGAYTAQENNKTNSRLESILVFEAGLIINLLTAGVYLHLAHLYYPLSFALTLSADIDIFLVIINLFPCSGSDGEILWSTALGINRLGKAAKRCLLNKESRRA